MNRRKLLRDKILDGEYKLTLDEVQVNDDQSRRMLQLTEQIMASPSTQTFLVLEESVLATGKLISTGKLPAFNHLFKAPFTSFVVEEVFHGGTYMHVGFVIPREAAAVLIPGVMAHAPVDVSARLIAYVSWVDYPEKKCAHLVPAQQYLWETDLNQTACTQMPSIFPDDPQMLGSMAQSCSWTMRVLFTMLNVKNATAFENVEVPAGLAEAKAKRGKPALCAYTYVHLLPGAETHHNPSNSTTAVAIRAAHVRRGHFKHLPSGAHWWNAHVVGQGAPQVRKAYVVGDAR